MTDYPNQPTAPELPTPPEAPVPPTPTLSSATADGNFFTEWVKPAEKWRDYDDYGLLPMLETGHLIMVGGEGAELTLPSSLSIPQLQIVSPLGKGVITVSSFSGSISAGQAIYLEDVEFPITGSTAKSITIGPLSNKEDRRTDRLFLGVRVGDVLYMRASSVATSAPALKVFDAVLAETSQDMTAEVTLNFVPTVQDTDTYTYDATDDDVEVLADGRYQVTFSVLSFIAGAGTGDAEFSAFLQVDSGGGFAAVAGSYVAANLDDVMESGSAAMTRVLELGAGDKVRVRALRSEGTRTLYASGTGTSMTVTRVA